MSVARWILLSAMTTVAFGMSAARGVERRIDPDEEVLRRAGLKTDDASLLRFLRSRSAGTTDQREIDRLVRQLGADAFRERQEASRKLVAAGLLARPALERVRKDPDTEIVRRADACWKQIEQDSRMPLPYFAARLLVRRRAEGAVEALLRYLPHEKDRETVEEIWFGLDEVGVSRGQAHPALVAALSHEASECRAVAACIVGRVGTAAQRAEVRKLLQDPVPEVRLRAAQGLLAAGRSEGVPTLIALLEEGGMETAWQAEELLRWLGGPGSPESAVGDARPAARRKWRRAWEAWWRKEGPNIDAAKVSPEHGLPGLLLICEVGGGGRKGGRVWVRGCDGTPRWEWMTHLRMPWDAQLLEGGRVLIAEGHEAKAPSRVTERDLKGDILKQYEEDDVRTCRRLANGTTFMGTFKGPTTTKLASEITARGDPIYRREISEFQRQILYRAPERLRNGHLFYAVPVRRKEDQWLVGEVDPLTGAETVRLRIDRVSIHTATVFQPGRRGGILLAYAGHWPLKYVETKEGVILLAKAGPYRPAMVKELNSAGETIWARAMIGIKPVRMVQLWDDAVVVEGSIDGTDGLVEISPQGKRVWEVLWRNIVRVRDCLGLVRLGFSGRRDRNWNYDTVARRIQELRDASDRPTRDHACRALERHGAKAEAAIPVLVENLDRCGEPANHALAAIGVKSIPELVKALKHKRPGVREAAAHCLAYSPFRDQGERFVSELIAALPDEDWRVRRSVAGTLGHCGPSAVPALARALKDERIEVAEAAVDALGRIRPMSEEAVSALIGALGDKKLRVWAARTLGAIGPAAKAAIPALQKAMKDEDQEYRRVVTEVLRDIQENREGRDDRRK